MSKMNADPSSLINMQRSYILNTIKGIQEVGKLYSLVIDDKIESVLSQVLTKDTLLRIVTAVEKIDKKRRQQQFLEAIYFVELTPFTIRCIVADVQVGRYKRGHSLFLPILPEDMETSYLFNSAKFIKNPKVLQYFDGGRSIHYINSCFHPVESRVFLADSKTPNSMPIYFNENCAEFVLQQVKLAARALVNMMVLTGEYPLVRYYASLEPNYTASRLSLLLADEFQVQIDDYARAHHDFPPVEVQEKPRSILLIVDRTIDLFAPLLHEFTYQAMAMDIVPSLEREGFYHFESVNEKGETNEVDAVLENENDDDWVNIRHQHIIESSELIINKINDLVQRNPMMLDRSKATTSGDLMYIVAHLKGFDDERRQIMLHKTLIDECLEINSTRKLAEFAADFEQTCAANGTSFEGIKNKHLANDLIDLLDRPDLHVNDKVRLFLIYGLYRGGLPESDFVKMAKFIGVKDRHVISLISRCFRNLHKLGFPIVKENVKDKNVEKPIFHTINNEGTYNTSRFGPGLKNVLQKAVNYNLNEGLFPYFRDKPLEEDMPTKNSGTMSPNISGGDASLRNSRIKASWAQSSSKVSFNLPSHKLKQRVFCYVAGGITYSEMRSIYELASATNKDFYIGSESILKPRDFLIGLQSIDVVKQAKDLNLNLYEEKYEPKEVPLYLFEQDSAKAKAQSAPPVPSLPQPSTSSSLPSHYQKRNSHQNYNPSPEILENKPEGKKDKKSKLKKLFS